MGSLWVFMFGAPMGIHGALCVLYGYLWVSMELYGSQWGLYGDLWGHSRSPWGSADLCRVLMESMGLYVHQ